MLDQAQIDLYRERGWLVVESVFERARADAIARLALEISAGELANAGANSDGSHYKVDRGADGAQAPRKIDAPFTKHAEFRAFVLDSGLRALLDQLLGDEALIVTDQIFMKPPRFGSPKPYHQDNAYFLCSPADQVITAWIALDDVEESNGCLRYIDGSHRGAILPHVPLPGEPHNQAPPAHLIDLAKESLAPVGLGGVVFHHSQTLHTSHRNDSERWRRGYATHWATAAVTAESPVLDAAYFKRPDYAVLAT